mmetsp:Transcript_34296/g.61573  ORF Transcript_34296/g.61573 Transcript_34296/m.61573 type:complete len:99 (+) Transcript_34296:769-1065(+)
MPPSSSRHQHQYEQNTKSKSSNCCIKYRSCQTEKRSTQILMLSFPIVWVILAQWYYYFHHLNLRNVITKCLAAAFVEKGEGILSGSEKETMHRIEAVV